ASSVSSLLLSFGIRVLRRPWRYPVFGYRRPLIPFIVKWRCHRSFRTTAALKSEPWADGEIAIKTGSGPLHRTRSYHAPRHKFLGCEAILPNVDQRCNRTLSFQRPKNHGCAFTVPWRLLRHRLRVLG